MPIKPITFYELGNPEFRRYPIPPVPQEIPNSGVARIQGNPESQTYLTHTHDPDRIAIPAPTVREDKVGSVTPKVDFIPIKVGSVTPKYFRRLHYS